MEASCHARGAAAAPVSLCVLVLRVLCRREAELHNNKHGAIKDCLGVVVKWAGMGPSTWPKSCELFML